MFLIPRWKLLTRALLLVFLLAAQGISLAHQSSHADALDMASCDFCFSCSELKHSTLEVHEYAPALQFMEAPVIAAGAAEFATIRRTPEARAPPLFC